jgi:HAD superfamily hydrolase (TIGR01509 family)
MRKKFILFDNDGVLVDTEYWYFRATKQALEELGVQLDHSVFMKIMISGESAFELAKAKDVDEGTIRNKMVDRTRYYQNFLRTKDIEIPGVEDTLRQLSKQFRMAIVTTSHRADFNIIHKDRSIVSYMDFVLAREDYINSKPDPEPYITGLQKSGAQPDEVLVVEDSERGLTAALAAGIDCAVVQNDFTKSHDFSKATHTLKNFSELPKLMEEIG